MIMKKSTLLTLILTVFNPLYTKASLGPSPLGTGPTDEIDFTQNSQQTLKPVAYAVVYTGGDTPCILSTSGKSYLVPTFLEAPDFDDLDFDLNHTSSFYPICEREQEYTIAAFAENFVEGPVEVALLPVLPVIAIAKLIAVGCVAGVVAGGAAAAATEVVEATTTEVAAAGAVAGAAGVVGVALAAAAAEVEVIAAAAAAAAAAVVAAVAGGVVGGVVEGAAAGLAVAAGAGAAEGVAAAGVAVAGAPVV